MQTIINFDNPSIRRHNNRESELQVVTNAEHFQNQTMWVLKQLLSGRKVTGRMARDEAYIEDVRARIHTLKRMGFEFTFNRLERGLREWYMTDEMIERNLKV